MTRSLAATSPPDMAFIVMSPSGWPSSAAIISWLAMRSASLPNMVRKDGESTLSHTGTLPSQFSNRPATSTATASGWCRT
jgi:hypothetical protein